MTRLLGHLFRLLREGLLARTFAIGTQRGNSALIDRDTQTCLENREQ
jgi:hypothetical protein